MNQFEPLGSLAVFIGVILLILGLAWFLKHKTNLVTGLEKDFDYKLLASHRLDPKHKICAFRWNGTLFSVLIGPSSICLLNKEEEDLSDFSSKENVKGLSPSFEDQLRRANK